jgi:kumamolisin
MFRRFLTTQQFDAYFSPTPQEEAAVAALLQREGFQIVTRMPNRALITASGTVTQIDRTFGTQMRHLLWVRDPNVKTASMLSPAIPAAMAGMVDDIVGLNDIVSPQPMIRDEAPERVAQLNNGAKVAPLALGGPATGPNGYYGPAEFQAAFDYPSESGYLGSGQLVGVVDGDFYSPSDQETYSSYFGSTYTGTLRKNNINSSNGGGFTLCTGNVPDNYSRESDIDVEMIVGMAPQVNINFYSLPTSGTGCTHTLNNAYTNILQAINYSISDHVKVLSLSFGQCENDSISFDNSLASAFATASSVGETVVASSGDDGYGGCDGNPNADQAQTPAADNNVTAIGGIQPGAVDGFESANVAWGTHSAGGGSSGYNSLHYGQDSSQKGVVPGNNRDIPDISMPAAEVAIVLNGVWYPNSVSNPGGTSVSAPLFAAGQAEINQESGKTYGSITNQLYNIYKTYGYGNYNPIMFRDITSGNTGTPAKTGWDYDTGLGQPDFRGIERVGG